MNPNQTLHPLSVQKIGRELAIAWEDGTETFIHEGLLRRACPCATCGGEPDVLGRVVRPERVYSAGSFDLVSFQFVGGYAIQPRWADGHTSGIYAFRYLRRLGDEGSAMELI